MVRVVTSHECQEGYIVNHVLICKLSCGWEYDDDESFTSLVAWLLILRIVYLFILVLSKTLYIVGIVTLQRKFLKGIFTKIFEMPICWQDQDHITYIIFQERFTYVIV